MAYWSDEFQPVQQPILRYGLAVVSVAIAIAIGLHAAGAAGQSTASLAALAIGAGFILWGAVAGSRVRA